MSAARLLATHYDSTDHVLIAQASHLSSFYPVWLDGEAVVRWLASSMVRGSDPGAPAFLPGPAPRAV